MWTDWKLTTNLSGNSYSYMDLSRLHDCSLCCSFSVLDLNENGQATYACHPRDTVGIAIYIHMPPYTLGFDLFSPPAEGIEGFHHAQLNRQEKG